MTEYQNIIVTNSTDGFLTITLNRPKVYNALSFDLLTELNSVINNINTGSIQAKGIIITGTDKSFCAGADIQQLADIDTSQGYKFAKFGQEVFSKLEKLAIPSIAAVNGFAFGGGCELAMATSIRIASHKAQFGQPEVKLGVIPGYGGTQRLARLVGKGRAIDLCLTGRFIDAATALNWGLVTQLTEPDNLLTYAQDYLKTICNMAPLALSGVLTSINCGYELSMEQALELEALHFAKTCGSNDKKIGVQAFFTKEPAKFLGN